MQAHLYNNHLAEEFFHQLLQVGNSTLLLNNILQQPALWLRKRYFTHCSQHVIEWYARNNSHVSLEPHSTFGIEIRRAHWIMKHFIRVIKEDTCPRCHRVGLNERQNGWKIRFLITQSHLYRPDKDMQTKISPTLIIIIKKFNSCFPYQHGLECLTGASSIGCFWHGFYSWVLFITLATLQSVLDAMAPSPVYFMRNYH